MKKFIIFLSIFLWSSIQGSIILGAAESYGFKISCVQVENNMLYEIKNISALKRMRKSADMDSKLDFLMKNYPLDSVLLASSKNVYLSIDRIDYASADFKTNEEDYFSDDEGYLQIYTCLYDRGFVNNGERLFFATAYVTFYKEFKMRNQDILLFRTGEGAVQYFDTTFSGNFSYEYALGTGTRYTQPVTIDYPSSYGILYLVDLPKNKTIPGIGTDFAVGWRMHGSYAFLAKSTTFVQVGYIHNERFFGNNLSVSIGPLSVNITGTSTKYYGKGINIYV